MQSYSDKRLKKNIKECSTNATDILKSIKIVEYEWKSEEEVKGDYDNKKLIKASKNSESGKRVGVLAQQLREILPSCIWGGEDNVMGVNWMAIIPFIIKSIQENNSASTLKNYETDILSNSKEIIDLEKNLSGILKEFEEHTGELATLDKEIADVKSKIGHIKDMLQGAMEINDVITFGSEDMDTVVRGDLFFKDIGVSNVAGPILQIDPSTGQIFYNNISDCRLKTHIRPFDDDVVERIGRINICKFDYKTPEEIKKFNNKVAKGIRKLPRESVGAIAQEMKEIFPECVNGADNSIYTINWLNMMPFLVKGFQDLADEIKNISKRISVVESLIN